MVAAMLLKCLMMVGWLQKGILARQAILEDMLSVCV